MTRLYDLFIAHLDAPHGLHAQLGVLEHLHLLDAVPRQHLHILFYTHNFNYSNSIMMCVYV